MASGDSSSSIAMIVYFLTAGLIEQTFIKYLLYTKHWAYKDK